MKKQPNFKKRIKKINQIRRRTGEVVHFEWKGLREQSESF